jgi:hypothetical protein
MLVAICGPTEQDQYRLRIKNSVSSFELEGL